MFCPQCGDEFREGFHRCPDCEVDLVEELGPEPVADAESTADDEPMVELGVTSDRLLLAVLKSTLEDAGIPYVLQGEESLALLPTLSSGGGTPRGFDVRVLVRQADLEAASVLVDSVADVAGDSEDDGEPPPGEEAVPEDEQGFSVPTSWFELATVLAVACLWSYFDSLAVWIWPEPAPQDLTSVYARELYGIFGYIPTILVVLFVVSSKDPRWKTHTGLTRPGVFDAFVALLILLPSLYLTPVTSGFLDLIYGPRPLEAPVYYPEATQAPEYLASFLGIAVAAFSEELVFRDYLIGRLRTLLGSRWLSVLVSALLFSGMHLYQGVDGVASSAAFGVFYGYIFSGSPRLWPLVLAHMLHNLLIAW
jgi:membrane protease YdiL (CAAX protease family)